MPDTADIQAEVISEWKAAFGQDLDIGPETPLGVMITAEVEARDNVGCLPPPAPAAWFMAPREANLTQRLLNELSPSPETVTKD